MLPALEPDFYTRLFSFVESPLRYSPFFSDCYIRSITNAHRFIANIERLQQYIESEPCGQDPQERKAIQVPLLPKCPTPKVLFGLAVLTLGGHWLSDYGFTTLKYSEPVAFMLWAVGFFGGAICGAALLLALANRYP